MDKEDKSKIKKLEERQELLRKKAFMMLIEIAFIFAVPAVIAFVLGGRLDAIFETGNTIILSSLAIAFILSWIIVIFRFKKLQKDFQKISEDIKKESGKITDDSGGNRTTPEEEK
ncbi:MAG: hypothetical protein R3346_04780 [Candidatus Spechtbacterales bacterium]|nr:hypothetical protein [Candidatus Spechtbacterales bacterium]